MSQYYEDLVIGQTDRFGSLLVDRDEVIAFATKYDPQPFHLSDEAAAKTPFGRLAASGWHTCAMAMSMVVAHMQALGHQGLGAPGVDELRWPKPVYPGDTLRCEGAVLSKRRSQSRSEMGLFRKTLIVRNQHDEVVMTFTSTGMVAVRNPGAKDPPAEG
jgi:acyl dehydratase